MVTTVKAKKLHKFEIAGLGKAPFKLVGVFEKWHDNGNGTRKPGGCCAYCFTGIKDCFQIESSDGKQFHVGSDCVRKTGDAGLAKVVDYEVARLKRDQRHAKEALMLQELEVLMANLELMDKIKGFDHPLEWAKAQGKTMFDWAIWMRANCGTSGKMDLLRALKKVV